MLNAPLPLDIWTNITGFLEILDLYSLLTTNKEINTTVDQDVIYEQFAKRKFPLYLLDTSVYENSWKTLLQHDNARNGYYRLQLNALSCWSRYDGTSAFHGHMIRTMAWDRQTNQIILDVEAFGENNLREASGTSFYRLDPTLRVATASAIPLVKIRCENYEYNGPSHKLCRIYLDASQFLPGHTYQFIYGRSRKIGGSAEYDCVTFLAGSDFSSLPELFEMPSLRERLKERTTIIRSSGYNGLMDATSIQPSGNCDFVSRSTPLQPSNVLEWQDHSFLPKEIRERHGYGAWGAAQLPPSYRVR
jgi:hypothetical protein